MCSLAAALAAVNGSPADKAFAAATDAWERGDYITALNGYIKLLEGPGGDAQFDQVALQTGELFESRELTRDGRNPRFSPDGKFAAYETGLEVSRRTRILRNDDALTPVADLPGVSATFSPNGSSVAYLKSGAGDALAAAVKAVDEAPLAAQNRNALIQALAWEVLRSSTIAIRDLNSGSERETATPGLLKTGLTYGPDGRTLYFLGGREGEDDRNDIYSVVEGGAPVRVGDAPGLKGVPTIDSSGAVLLYTVPNQNPFRRPQPPGQGGGGPGGAQPRPPSFGVILLASGRTTVIEGSAPHLSADGQSLAFVARAGSEYQLMLGAPAGPHAAVKRSTDRLDSPALSSDGQRIAYQMMTRDDWELYVAARDGGGETRVTRDIQHDLLPRFLGADRLFSVVGEPRHRRSYVIDIASAARTRLFHNNTVRTIAPEYQWVLSSDGNHLLVGAERDGDTVSPERGVYIVHLQKKITKAALLERLRANLAGEVALRAGATKTFAAVASDVKRVVDTASVVRVYGYEKALFDFDSKHISRPGNQRAAEYLFNTYASFGYQPEYQWFENRNALGGKTANVIATLRGTVNPELVYVVSSHYDSVAAGPGADDDSSGTAALLEAARVLAGNPQPATIVFASFTGEESGLLGSREFVRRAVEGKMQIVGALNNDMIGFANDQRLDNTIRYSNPGIRDIQHGAAMLFTRLITYDALYFKGTDAAAYYDAYGDIVGGIGSYPVLSSPHYHQPHDLLEFENHELITETSKTTTATLMLLASSPSRIRRLQAQRSGEAVTVSWTPSPEKGITSYIVAYGSASEPMSRRTTVKLPEAKLPSLAPGSVISVKAVNARGLEGWDWARVVLE
jgi:Tol biopolymer transport system component